MALPSLPADIVNRALDSIGADTVIGDFTDGTTASEVARRGYGRTLRELLRGAHWNFARAYKPLLLLADVTGQTLDPGTGEAISTAVEPPWIYSYAWPNDAVAARWLPWNMTPVPTTPPLMTGLATLNQTLARQAPARFLVSSSPDFPAATGQVDWDNLPDLGEGQGLISRRIILTNVPQASFVYTRLVTEIAEWDALFEQAMVACLAARMAMSVLEDKKRAMAERAAQIAIAREALMEARVRNANDAGFPQSVNRTPDWIRARRYGAARWGAWGPGEDMSVGVLGYGWEPMAFADGSVM